MEIRAGWPPEQGSFVAKSGWFEVGNCSCMTRGVERELDDGGRGSSRNRMCGSIGEGVRGRWSERMLECGA